MAAKGYACVLTLGGTTIGNARNVSPTMEATEQDKGTRADGAWDNWQQGRKRLSFDLDALWVPTATGLAALQAAWFADSDLAFTLLDEDGYGYSGTCGVLTLGRGEGLDDPVTVTASLKSRGTVTSTTGTS